MWGEQMIGLVQVQSASKQHARERTPGTVLQGRRTACPGSHLGQHTVRHHHCMVPPTRSSWYTYKAPHLLDRSGFR
jgi:hypothetical protein